MFAQRLQDRPVVRIAAVPAADRAGRQRQLRMRDHAIRVAHLHLAETVAARAGAVRRVERKQPRFQFRQRIAADRAGHLGAEGDVLAFAGMRCDIGQTVGQLECGFEGFRQALLQSAARISAIRGGSAHLEAVDHHLHVMLELAVEAGDLLQFVDAPVDARTHEALRAHLFEDVRVLALAAADHRRQQQPGRAFGLRQHAVDHLRHFLRFEHGAVIGAARLADAREQQAQVIVDFGDGADGRARVVRGRLLLDRNRRRQALNGVHVRLLHHRQELPSIGRQRFDIAALALGIERVEGERGLAGTGQAGEHDQLIARQVQRNILEIVRARAADADGVHGHGGRQGQGANRVLYAESFSRRKAPLASPARSMLEEGCSPPCQLAHWGARVVARQRRSGATALHADGPLRVDSRPNRFRLRGSTDPSPQF